MRFKRWSVLVTIGVLSLGLLNIKAAFAGVKGIYISQPSATNTAKMKYFIRQAKASGINTFVIDIKRPSTQYARAPEDRRSQKSILLHNNTLRFT